MASGEESERIIRRVYEVMGEGGSVPDLMEKLEPLLTPDAEWVNPEHAIERGTRVGLEGWTTAIENTQGGLGENVSFRLEELIVLGEDRVFVRGHIGSRGTSSGVEVGQAIGTDWTIQDGRVRRMEWSFDVDELLERAQAEASSPG
jgi:ketosteroid isomerase-like protein